MVKVELLYKNGDLYYGEVVEGQLEGKGVYRFKDGSSYEGEFKKNVFNGRGKLIDVFNEVTIVGEFQDGLAYGQCNISYSDGSTYQGRVESGQRAGKGIFVFALNCPEKQYRGNFIDDTFAGYGELQFRNGDYYKGNFTNGQYSSEGELKTADYQYVGDFSHGCLQGKGWLKLKNGDTYEGNFHVNMMHGHGIYTYTDGSVYKGEWQNNKKHGLGKIITKNGQVLFEGNFSNDEYQEEGRYFTEGWEINSTFSDSQLDGKTVIKKQNAEIIGYYANGVKEGLFTMKQILPSGKTLTYRGEFRNDKQRPHTISYSGRG